MKKLIILSLFSIFIFCGCSNNKEEIEPESLVIKNTNTKETFEDNPKVEMTKEEDEEKENIEIITKKMYVSAQNGLNIREFASIDSSIVDTVPANTELDVVEGFYIGDWVRVLYNEKECYVNSKYLSEEKVEVNKEQTNNSSSNGSYLGNYKITHYCACNKCSSGTGITASGTQATVGRTVACNSLSFGTKVIINGNTYTIEDTGGMNGNTIDIFVSSHEECLQKGVYYTEVWMK